MKVHFCIPSDKMRNIIYHSQELVSFRLVWIAYIHLFAASYQHTKLLICFVRYWKYTSRKLISKYHNSKLVIFTVYKPFANCIHYKYISYTLKIQRFANVTQLHFYTLMKSHYDNISYKIEFICIGPHIYDSLGR